MPSLFDKCNRFTTARDLQNAGTYPYFRPISESADTVVVIDGEERIMMGSNNYLGLTHHPEVLGAAREALRRYGSGSTGSRLLNGTLDLHGELERELAAFLGKDDCLVFSTGYQANLGLISTLVGRGDLVLLDKLDHASLLDGAKLSYGEARRFRHGDLGELAARLSQVADGTGVLIAVDGVFSMDGDIADLPGLAALARRHGAALAVDDAHALGVLGPQGQGTAGHYGMTGEVDLIVGTFSKALGSIGGYIAGDEHVVHFLRHQSRPLMFTASLPAVNTAGVLAALRVLRREPERRAALWRNTARLRDGLRAAGFDLGATRTPIIPVLTGTPEATYRMWSRLFEAGVFTNPVVPPAVAAAGCRLRMTVTATHTDEQLDHVLDVFVRLSRELLTGPEGLDGRDAADIEHSGVRTRPAPGMQ
ncbi:8-amino-7-oxononanoate synthase [Allocatelliglobosispora scoriae]|uniref:8-amino-7-oxononanoate synthase n=1 Tax=Allocatelliglobosispora scoriae TaxID=643052 RepID=A0A841BZA8_9ACTN|nr:pyridoxal phosphate-dependent aminotransferase family protein [Allocatelliglobosispora scoriae]MBB5874487.1 8-amino-7-oxononanoate synthase [Allocatelliglobosispora scoriae]